MATQLTKPGLVVKWIVIPVLVACVGYYLVGPRIGKSKLAPTLQESSLPTADSSPSPTSLPLGGTDKTPVAGKVAPKGASENDNFPQAPPPSKTTS